MSTTIHARVSEASLAVCFNYFSTTGIHVKTKSHLVALIIESFAQATGFPKPTEVDGGRIIDRHFGVLHIDAPTPQVPAAVPLSEQVLRALEGTGYGAEE